jgi:cysteine desulfuration protein SufE
MLKLHELAAEFEDLDDRERLETLIDFSETLPAPTGAHGTIQGDESCRVQECQTPVYLWIGLRDGMTEVEADVPRSSPTVRGLVALLVEGIQGQPPEHVLQLPDDLLPLLGLESVLGMTRRQGVRGMIARIKRELIAALDESSL